MKIYKSKINCSNSVYALNDIYNVIKNYGNKYFDAKKYYNYVVLTIFDVGSYTISYYDDDITSEEIVVKSLDDPTEEVRTFHSISELKDWLDRVINVRNQSYDEFNNLNSNSYKLNYTTPEMKELKRAISKIVVDNDKEFIDLIDAILNDEPINEVPEVRSLHRAINRCVVDSDEELRDLILQVAADVGVISDIHSIHEETSNPYNKQTNYIANNLTFCPNCHGDRFNDKAGLCLDCGYDEKAWSTGPYYDQEYDDYYQYDNSIESANDIGYSDYNDPRLQPPEYNEPVEEDSQIETIELTLIQVPITVDNEGYWEYGDVQWSRNPESANGNWYSEDNIEINTPVGIQEDVDRIIEKYIPGYAGRYTISCDIELIYNIDNIQANYDYYGPDDYDRTVLTDEVEVKFNENGSVVSNFSYSEIK